MKKNLGLRTSMAGAVAALLLGGCETKRKPVLEPTPIPYSTTIDARVQRLLASDPTLRGHDIKVNTFQGEVKLDGVVETEEQRLQATRLAWTVEGVRAVENNLLLRSEKRP